MNRYSLWKGVLRQRCYLTLPEANLSGGFNQTHIGLDSYYGQYEEEAVICTMKGNQGLFRCASGFLETYRVGLGRSPIFIDSNCEHLSDIHYY